jgi:hypothetical protein
VQAGGGAILSRDAGRHGKTTYEDDLRKDLCL